MLAAAAYVVTENCFEFPFLRAQALRVAIGAIESMEADLPAAVVEFADHPSDRGCPDSDRSSAHVSPYTGTAAPLVTAAASLQRNRTTSAISSGVGHAL